MTADDRVKLLIGELTLQNIVLRTENEQLKAEKAVVEAAGMANKEPKKPEA